ncbi:hypothetical protein BZL54_22845 [Burkholderia ubonensis subsp. mesacidophila]|uniref:Uncharacterized protein n=1 Tax=Burkholderia ubonensis subsp. mesacidophila TaxID=265293 RepID=A0A2A4FA47_9BURK|nr:hypothetical protein BZL54_22845 [Burkholderia ubonensis subsp. mesacidophila]
MGMRSKSLLFSCIFLFCCASQARGVKSIEIHEYGKSRDAEMAGACKKFRPTVKQVRNFFLRAYPVEGYMLSHERYSSCYATGALKFDDGSSGTWKLSSSGVATFIFTRGDVVTLYYKNNKWYDPFACTYGLGDVGEC